ncbi:MAG TPA: TIGR00366 family protein [Candidatus Xenobia bacterium]|jgi:short-chain fatty acids transporter
MLSRISEFFVGLVERWLPDPYLLCICLTLATGALALAVTGTPFDRLLNMWYDGLWAILPFATLTILVLLTGYTLAHAPGVRRLLAALAARATVPSRAVAAVIVITAVSSWINWGFGLVAGGLVACEVARRVRVDFPFLVAAAYSGFVVWASGLSSSIALITATRGNKMNVVEKLTGHVIPLSQTLFTPLNLVPTIALVVVIPMLFTRMIPAEPRVFCQPAEAESPPAETDTPASRFENSPILSLALAGLGVACLAVKLRSGTFVPDLNSIVFIFLMLGVLAHRTPIRFARTFVGAARMSGPLLLQYPLYGGIMAMMSDSGLAQAISRLFVGWSSAHTLPFWSFVSSCIISLFVPSGGGHWAVQAPIMVPAAVQLGASQGAVAMGVAFGEQVANMIQPFWALPILAIAGLGIRDIMGYCVITLGVSFLAYGLSLLVFS